ncbi:IS6 family transposase, partial [Aneurinibacillus migulanus]|nr:IS6 family transposase [Aneurinibacillus migulanus]
SRTLKGIDTINAIYKQNRSLRPNCGFSTYNELQKLLTIA